MNLGRVRALVRPVLSLPNEYRLRSLAMAVLPHQPPSVRRGLHFCNWKTGSQWVRLVLSDPRLHAHTGLPARLHHNGLGAAPLPVAHQYPRTDHHIATPLFAGADALGDLDADERDRAVFVTRNPRDLLVSFYFTNLENHPLNDDVAARRRELASVDLETGLLRSMDHGFDEMVRIGDSWAVDADALPCPVSVFPYETLSGDDAESAWTTMLRHLTGAEVPLSLVRSLLATYATDNMRSGDSSKLRDRTSSGWRHHFTEAVEHEFRDRYGDVEERWGYPSVLLSESDPR